MDILKTSGEMLRFVFARLRNQEGIEKGRTTTYMSDELIFKVLVNAKFKQEKGLPLTELEESVKRESGSYISMYVSQKWEDAKKESSYKNIPFSEVSHMTISDLTNKKTILRNQIA